MENQKEKFLFKKDREIRNSPECSSEFKHDSIMKKETFTT